VRRLHVSLASALLAPLFAWVAVSTFAPLPVATVVAILWTIAAFVTLDLGLSKIDSASRPVARVFFPLLLVLPVLYVLSFFAGHLVNNLRLAKFEDQLFDYPLPEGAEVAGRSSQVGVLLGNGNHCDFVVEQSLRTVLTVEEVRSYYSSFSPRHAIPGGAGAGAPNLQVYRPCCAEDEPILVSLVDAPYEGILDVRCH
jgi:uncharacterized membrane protein YtjA (UPF0391 family)